MSLSFLYDSPQYLTKSGKSEDATISAKFYYGNSYKSEIEINCGGTSEIQEYTSDCSKYGIV